MFQVLQFCCFVFNFEKAFDSIECVYTLYTLDTIRNFNSGFMSSITIYLVAY